MKKPVVVDGKQKSISLWDVIKQTSRLAGTTGGMNIHLIWYVQTEKEGNLMIASIPYSKCMEAATFSAAERENEASHYSHASYLRNFLTENICNEPDANTKVSYLKSIEFWSFRSQGSVSMVWFTLNYQPVMIQ